jgi:uncharacterized Fe-S cluster protein YjdI
MADETCIRYIFMIYQSLTTAIITSASRGCGNLTTYHCRERGNCGALSRNDRGYSRQRFPTVMSLCRDVASYVSTAYSCPKGSLRYTHTSRELRPPGKPISDNRPPFSAEGKNFYPYKQHYAAAGFFPLVFSHAPQRLFTLSGSSISPSSRL